MSTTRCKHGNVISDTLGAEVQIECDGFEVRASPENEPAVPSSQPGLNPSQGSPFFVNASGLVTLVPPVPGINFIPGPIEFVQEPPPVQNFAPVADCVHPTLEKDGDVTTCLDCGTTWSSK